MNIAELHSKTKKSSFLKLFEGTRGVADAIHLEKGEIVHDHTSKVPALLLCISGCTGYQEKGGKGIELKSGDFVSIRPDVVHGLRAIEDSQLVLLK